MAWAQFEAFLPEVLPYVRECPEIAAINAIRNTCIEFCEQSQFLRYQHDPITIAIGQAEYDLEVPAGYGVCAIIACNLGYRPLVPKAEEELVRIAGPSWRTEPGSLSYIVQDTYDTVRVVAVPDQLQDDPLTLTLAIRPLRSAVKIDAVILERWSEVIGYGTRARLHDTPGQPYSDMEAAKRFRKWFQSGYGRAKIEANRGLGRGPIVALPNRLV